MNNPLVSIIIPFFNGSKFISKSIQSVLNQTLSDWEIILINDASTDNSPHIASNFCRHDESTTNLSLSSVLWTSYKRSLSWFLCPRITQQGIRRLFLPPFRPSRHPQWCVRPSGSADHLQNFHPRGR